MSAEATSILNIPDIRKQLNKHVRVMAQTVDDDWHDSYEETDEMLGEWLEDSWPAVPASGQERNRSEVPAASTRGRKSSW